MKKITYTGYGKTEEEACKDLERQLQLDANSGAFVTISDPPKNVIQRVLSPRVALANIRDGTPYKVKFSPRQGTVRATVGFNATSPITSPRGNKEELIF